MSTAIQNVTKLKVIRDGSGLTSRVILTPVIANRIIRNGLGPQGPAGSSAGLTKALITASQTLAVNTSYTVTAIALASCPLPTTATRGDVIELYGYGLGGYIITVPAGKVIHFLGSADSSNTDGTGYVASRNQFDMVRLRCVVDNNEWSAELWGCTTL